MSRCDGGMAERVGRLFCCIRREARLLGGAGRPAAAAARKGKAG